MSNPWFRFPDRIAKLEQSALSWIGTPFHPNGCVKGAGVSCQMLVAAVYMEAGFLPSDFLAPSSDMAWGRFNKHSQIVEGMEMLSDRFEVIDPFTFSPGDMLGIEVGQCIHHCGLYVDRGTFVHVWRGHGVSSAHVDDSAFVQRIKKVWRPIEP